MSTIKANYRCSQSALYVLCRLAWANFNSNLARFNAFKPFYDTGFYNARFGEINAAEDLPNEQTRDDISETSRITLTQKAEICLDAWRFLERYIITAFPEPFTKPKLEAAGSDFYTQAAAFNWESLQSMMNAGENFITTHNAELSANNNMPAAFPGALSTAKSNFDTELSIFLEAEETRHLGADVKVSANNNLQIKVMAMLLDGQTIFQNEPSPLQLFIYDHLLDLITNHIAGLKGTVTTGVADSPLEDCTLEIVELAKSTPSAEDGRYDFGRCTAGTYTVKCSKEGFTPQTLTDVEIAVGTTVTKNFSLAPAA